MVVPGGCFRCFCGVLTPVWVFQPTTPYLIHLRTPNLEPTADRASAWEAAPPRSAKSCATGRSDPGPVVSELIWCPPAL